LIWITLNFICIDYKQFMATFRNHTPPHSLKDSNVSIKMKTTEKGFGVCSLVCSISRVKGCVGVLRWGLKRVTNRSLFTRTCINQTTSWLMHGWNIFDAWMNQGHTQIHKTHHGLDLKEAITFPLIVFFVISHMGYI